MEATTQRLDEETQSWVQAVQRTRDNKLSQRMAGVAVFLVVVVVAVFFLGLYGTLVDMGQDAVSHTELKKVRYFTDRRDVSPQTTEVRERMTKAPVMHQRGLSRQSVLWPASSRPSWWMPIEVALFDLWSLLSDWSSISDSHPLTSKEAWDRLQQRKKQCEGLTDIEKISDASCRAEWMAMLASSPILEVDKMLGFGRGKRGAMRIRLEDGRDGWFKPCGGSGEYPEMEIISSALDWTLGWNRVMPVISRNITFQEIHDALVSSPTTSSGSWLEMWSPLIDRRLLIAHQTLQSCSYDGNTFSGAVIGWWSQVSPARTLPKTFGYGPSEHSIQHDLRPNLDPHFAAAVSQNHFFFYLLDILRRPGYNEYQTTSHPFPNYPTHLGIGSEASRQFPNDLAITAPFPSQNKKQREEVNPLLIALDLDRASFNTYKTAVRVELSVCYVCRIWKSMYQQIMTISSNPSLISFAVEAICSVDPSGIALTRADLTVLENRFGSIKACIDECIRKYGIDQVLVDDDVPLSP